MSLAAAATLFVGLLTSCSDADLPADNTSKYTDGVGLSFVISLNNLDGGMLAIIVQQPTYIPVSSTVHYHDLIAGLHPQYTTAVAAVAFRQL